MSNSKHILKEADIPRFFDVTILSRDKRIGGDRDTRDFLERLGLSISDRSGGREFYSVTFPEGWSFLGPRRGTKHRIYMDAEGKPRFSVSIEETQEFSHYVVDDYSSS